MSFLRIAFEQDCNHYENPEFEEMARRNCNEDPETRQKIIEELRSMIIRRGQCHPRRMDDAYLLRFLRCRQFIPALAHRLVVRYEDFRRRSSSLYNCDVFKLRNEVYISSYPECPVNGRIIIFRLDKLDLHELQDVMRAGLLFSELGVHIPRLQILGITVILDFKDLSLKHLSKFTPLVAYQFISVLGINFPVLTHNIHLVNYNWLLRSFFFIGQQFIPKGAENIIHFHGSDMNSLHKHIDPVYLPEEYGGASKHVIYFNDWLLGIEKYFRRNDYLVKEFRHLGYTI